MRTNILWMCTVKDKKVGEGMKGQTGLLVSLGKEELCCSRIHWGTYGEGQWDRKTG